MREHTRIIINITNEKRAIKQYGFFRDFKDRYVPQMFFKDLDITFLIECFYKNFNDQDPCLLNVEDHNEQHSFPVFKTWNLKFGQNNLQAVYLVPQAIVSFQKMIKKKTGLNMFPFAHTYKLQQITCVDIHNEMGRGSNACYSICGLDKSHVMYAFPSIEDYISTQSYLLATDSFQVIDGEVSMFRNVPETMYGSTTVTRGIKIQAQAYLVHMFCRLDKQIFSDAPKFYFVY